MNPALWISKTGLDAQNFRMAVVSNNLANVSTTGFKRDRANFEDLFYQQLGGAGGTADGTLPPSSLTRGTGVRVVSTDKQHTQGNLAQTDNSFDMAISGRGFFQVLQPNGATAYTRAGNFNVGPDGSLLAPNGYPLQPNISVPDGANAISIGADGAVSVEVGGSVSQIGNITLVDFVNPVGLRSVGENIYQETVASGAPSEAAPQSNGLGAVRQGFLETSNVNIVEEMISMIETQRAYEINSKAISTTDQMLQYLNNNV